MIDLVFEKADESCMIVSFCDLEVGLEDIFGSGVAVQNPISPRAWSVLTGRFTLAGMGLLSILGVSRYVMISDIEIMLRFDPDVADGDQLISELAGLISQSFDAPVSYEASWRNGMASKLTPFEDLGYLDSTTHYIAAAAEIVTSIEHMSNDDKVLEVSRLLRMLI